MKNLLLLIPMVLLLACNSSTNSSAQNAATTETPVQSRFTPLDGIWYHVPFIDSSIINRKILYYVKNGCAWTNYAIEFNISNPDSCRFIALNDDEPSVMDALKRVSNDTCYVDRWRFVFNNHGGMTATLYWNSNEWKNEKPQTYFFQKKNIDLTTPEKLNKYFVKNIFAGVYRDGTTEMTLTEDGRVLGIDSLVSFTIHYEDGKSELIGFKDKKNKKGVSGVWPDNLYGWQFEGDYLCLQKPKYPYVVRYEDDPKFNDPIEMVTVRRFKKIK